MQKHALTVLIALVSVCNVGAQDADPIEKKLDAALVKYDSTIDAAAKQLHKSLNTARDSAQRRGDLDALKSIDSEIEAFKIDLVLPKSVSVTAYQRSTQRAVARVKVAYENAIRNYTKNDNIPLAKQLQSELEEIRKSGTVAVDPLRKHRVWVKSDPPMNFTVIRRSGNAFQARFRVGKNIDRLITGNADGKSLNWKSANVVVRGGRGPGGDNAGTIHKDEQGYRIDMEWKDQKGNGGKFTLRPKKS